MPKPPSHDHGIWCKILQWLTKPWEMWRSSCFESQEENQCSDCKQQEALQVWTDYESQPMSNTWILLSLPMLITREPTIIQELSKHEGPRANTLAQCIIEHSTETQQSSWARHAKWTRLFSLAFSCFLLSISKKMQKISGYHMNFFYFLSHMRILLQKTSSTIHNCRILNLEPALSQANFDHLDASH